MKKVIICFGTRPEAIKLAPVIIALRKRQADFECIVCSTGQHREMVDQALDPFDVKIDIQLDAMSKAGTLGNLTAALFSDMESVLAKIVPDCVIVQGDTTSAFVAAMTAFYRQIPVAHVEAGLRTFDRFSPFPEEINRVFISRIADFNFAPTSRSSNNLLEEKLDSKRIFITGNTVVDALQFLSSKLKRVKKKEDTVLDNFLKLHKIILVTSHRRENFGEGLENICKAVLQIINQIPEAGIIFPVHLNPTVQKTVYGLLGNNNRILLISPVDYFKMVYLMDVCYCILSDSGGIQEEAPSLRKPLLILRETTERPEAVESGCAMLVGTSVEKITNNTVQLFSDQEFYNSMSSGNNPFGDGLAAEKIVDILAQHLLK